MFLDESGKHVTTDKGFRMAKGNVGVREGRWYWECKITSGDTEPKMKRFASYRREGKRICTDGMGHGNKFASSSVSVVLIWNTRSWLVRSEYRLFGWATNLFFFFFFCLIAVSLHLSGMEFHVYGISRPAQFRNSEPVQVIIRA